jgi:hypothetical protein
MKISDEYLKDSIFPEYVIEQIIDDREFFIEIGQLIFEHANIRIKEYSCAVQYLQSRDYSLARSGIDRFDSFHSTLVVLRKTLRSLISGIVITSTISNQNAIADYKKKWEPYDDNERSVNTFYFHHQFIYQQFKKIKTLDELAAFNEFFHQYLLEMAFKLAEIFIQRLNYTVEYFQYDGAFKDVFRETTLHLENFRNEIQKLKQKP